MFKPCPNSTQTQTRSGLRRSFEFIFAFCVLQAPWHQLKVHRIGTRESDDQWVDGDELGARLQLLKPYHRATAIGDAVRTEHLILGFPVRLFPKEEHLSDRASARKRLRKKRLRNG